MKVFLLLKKCLHLKNSHDCFILKPGKRETVILVRNAGQAITLCEGNIWSKFKSRKWKVMNRFEAIIFDMDGLLLDSERISMVAFNETLEYFGLGNEPELFLKTIGTNAQSCRMILKKGLENKVDSDKFGKAWFEKYIEKTTSAPVPLKNGAKELLIYIRNMGIPVAVATSTGTNLAKKKLENAGISKYFNVVIGGDQVQKGKPDPEIYLKVADSLSVNPEKCLGLEDSENGVKSALAAGLTVIQIPDMVQPDKDFKSLGHTVLECLDEVIGYKF